MRPTTAIVTNYGLGGSLFYLQQLAHALEQRAFPVVFYLPVHTDISISDRSLCRFELKEPSLPPARAAISLLKYLYHLSRYLYNAFVLTPEPQTKIAHLLFPFYLTDWITVTRLKRKGVKVLVTVHEVVPHKAFLGGRADRIFLKALFGRADILAVHTESLKNLLEDTYKLEPRKVRVIPHGYFEHPRSTADTDFLKNKYGVPSGRKVLLFFGTIRGNKGLDVLLKAMKGLEKDFFLVIAGKVEGAWEIQADYYRQIIRDNGVGSSLHWVDKYISGDDLGEVFSITDAVVLPYKKTYNAQSGVLNLAVGFEKPVVIADVGGIGETVKRYGLGSVVEPESAEALRDGICELFGNGQRSFGFAKYKEENSWDWSAVCYIAIYQELSLKAGQKQDEEPPSPL